MALAKDCGSGAGEKRARCAHHDGRMVRLSSLARPSRALTLMSSVVTSSMRPPKSLLIDLAMASSMTFMPER